MKIKWKRRNKGGAGQEESDGQTRVNHRRTSWNVGALQGELAAVAAAVISMLTAGRDVYGRRKKREKKKNERKKKKARSTKECSSCPSTVELF